MSTTTTAFTPQLLVPHHPTATRTTMTMTTTRSLSRRAHGQLQKNPLHFHDRLQHRHEHDMITALQMMMDPAEAFAAASTVLGHVVHDVASASTSIPSASAATSSSSSSLEAIVSTMYAQTSAIAVVEAHGHSQPFWGPADAYLTAGKSIAPPTQNLIDMGIITSTAAKGGGGNAAADALSKDNSELARTIQEEMSKGWKFLDYNNIQIKNLPGQPTTSQGSYMPGFVDPASTSLLSQPETRLYPDYNETPETFVLMVKWASGLINVIDKLPIAAFCYALIEFFILRPNLDTTKRQVLQEPGASTAESIATTSVRLSVFMFVALFTLIIFG
jgi:hypothetical protein